MKKVGIFFGSDTGNTEKVAGIIHKKIGKNNSFLYDISNSSKKDIESFDNLIFGIPTWYYGEVQCDWDEFLPILKQIDFSNKTIALFGCGDQEDYSEYFCDALSVIYKIIKKNKANIIGEWSTKGYHFDCSKSLLNKNYFMGLALDEDRQSNQTKNRIKIWINDIILKFS
ncbi:Flavodoxin 1 [Buchnera aphidicola (Protaphis terricola)]|uniref:flavodoxin FldA n=1 Tax=Buchnera aphidicola TaxID=9 RepID=UPI0034645377